jgi:hypothetical protein
VLLRKQTKTRRAKSQPAAIGPRSPKFKTRPLQWRSLLVTAKRMLPWRSKPKMSLLRRSPTADNVSASRQTRLKTTRKTSQEVLHARRRTSEKRASLELAKAASQLDELMTKRAAATSLPEDVSSRSLGLMMLMPTSMRVLAVARWPLSARQAIATVIR